MEELLNIIKNFKNPKVLVVGDIMLDEYVWGDVTRISPEAPIPVLEVKEVTYTPGGAANTANNLKALRGEVILAGVIGPEDKGKLLKEILEKRGINTEGIFVDQKRKTTLKTRAVARNQQLVRIDSEDRNPLNQEIEDRILNFIKRQIKETNFIIISDYAKGVITQNLSKKIIALANQNNVLCLVDPKGNDYLKYKNCKIITPNGKELAQALNLQIEQIETESKFLQAGKMLLSHVMCDNVLVTRGAQGMTLFGRDGNVDCMPALNKKAIDVSGAGDTAVATFALALAAGANPKQAMIIASHACTIVVGKVGTAVASPEELEENLRNSLIYEKKQD